MRFGLFVISVLATDEYFIEKKKKNLKSLDELIVDLTSLITYPSLELKYVVLPSSAASRLFPAASSRPL